MAGIFLIIASLIVHTQINSKKMLDSEVHNTQMNVLENTASPLDQHFQDATRTLSTLVINDNVRLMLSSNKEYATENFGNIVKELLLITRYSNKSISNIYLFSEYNDLFITNTNISDLNNITTEDWMDMLCPDANGISIFPYTSGNQIHGTFCIAKEFYINNNRCVICMKIAVPQFSTIKSLYHTTQNFYIISDENDILFLQSHDDSAETLSDSSHLAFYDASAKQANTIYKIGDQSWALTQQHSDKYPWTYVICNPLETYDDSIRLIVITTILLLTVVILLSIALAFILTYYSAKPISNLRTLLDTTDMTPGGTNNNIDDINYVANQITQYIQTNQQLSDQLQKRLQLLHDTHLQALQFQINPHFMFNTLNMLNIMAENALGFDHEMPAYTKKLIKILRYSLEPDYMVTLKQELQYNDIYLELLNRRYENTINIFKSIDDNTLNAQIPRLIIQPLIENAAFHGFSKKKHVHCAIAIRCYFKDHAQNAKNAAGKKYCVIEVNDNGSGMDMKTLAELRRAIKESQLHTGKNIGIKNVAQRLELSYLGEATLEITSKPGEGSCFTMTFPYIQGVSKILANED